MRDTLAVLRNRNIALLLSGRFISSSGDWIYQIALMLAIFQYSGGKSYYVGLFWLIRLIPNLLLGPPAGVLADRMGYRTAMIAADLWRMVLVVVLAFTLTASTWAIIFPLAFAVTVGSVLFGPANVGLIPSLVTSAQERLAANAAIMQVTSVALIVGSAIGGLATGLGYRPLLLVEAATFLVSALSLLLIHPHAQTRRAAFTQRETEAMEEEEPEEKGIIAGFRMLASRPLLLFAAAIMALPELASGAMQVWVVPYSDQVLHLHASGVGYLYAALGLGTLVGGVVATILGNGVRLDYLLAISVAAGGLAVTLFGAIPIAASALLFLLLVGLSETVEYAAYETLLQQAVPDTMIGQAAGTMNSYLFNMVLVGNVLSGFLATWIGVQSSIIGLGILTIIVTGVSWWYLQSRTIGRPDASTLAAVPAFKNVPFAVREWAVRRMSREDFPARATVIQAGEEGDKFYTIAKGKARVYVPAGEESLERVLGPGSFFGEIALIKHVPRTATVCAETPLTLWVLGRDDFNELQERATEFKDSLLETASTRLAATPNLQLPIATRT